MKKSKFPIQYHGKLLQRPQIWPLRIYGNSPLCPTGHRPFGAAAQKGVEEGKELGRGRK